MPGSRGSVRGPIGRTLEKRGSGQRTPFFDFFTTSLPFAAAVFALMGGTGRGRGGTPVTFFGTGLAACLAATLGCFASATGAFGFMGTKTVQLQRRSAALLRLPPKTEESHATLLPHPSSSLPDLSRQSNRDPLRALRRPRSDAGMNSPSRCFEMHHRLAPPLPEAYNHGAKDDQVTACLGYDLSSDDCWSPDVEGRSSAIGGGHQFACGNRELVSQCTRRDVCSARAGALPAPSGLAPKLRVRSAAQSVHLPALLAASSVTIELPDKLR